MKLNVSLKKQAALLSLICSSLNLVGCIITNYDDSDQTQVIKYTPNSYYRSTPDNYYQMRGPQEVTVPESSFFAGRVTPKSHQELDEEWVKQQDSGNYTIEVASDSKPAVVANTLQEAPKLARKAQIKKEQAGQVTYTGVYGSYPNKAAAEAALNQLPSDVRAQAKVKQWDALKSDAPLDH